MLNRQFCMALTLVASVFATNTALAQERAAMESWACNYVEGKGHDDLDLGATADAWMAEGGDLNDEFNSVIQCGAHTMAGSREIRAYENAGEAGIVQLSACTVKEGVSWAQVASADQAWADFMTENELPGGIYRWGAGPGTARESKMDFYAVWITESLAQRGAAIDKFRTIEGSGQTYRNIYGDDNLYTCDNARIYHAVPVGGSD